MRHGSHPVHFFFFNRHVGRGRGQKGGESALPTSPATISIPFLAAKSDIARCCASILSSRWLSEENRAYDTALSGVLGWFGINLMIKALEDHAYSLAGETVEDHKRKCRKIYPANGIIYQKQG